MKTLRHVATTITLLAFLVSCGDTSLFVPDVEEQPDVAIVTIEDGTLIGPEDTIPLSIQYSDASRSVDQSAKELEIVLSDVASGAEVAASTLGSDELMQESLPPIELTGLPTGLYSLELVLTESERVVAATRVEFFHVVETYSLLGIASYPPSFYPGASGLLHANIDVPEGADPYLRWRLSGEVVATGTVSEGANEVIVRSPATEGVYPVQVELFPTEPTDRLDYDFPSQVTQVTDLYVTENLELGEYELAPEISYYSLFHFRGELRDHGVAAGTGGSSLRATPIGEPDLRIDGEIFGYHLDGESGFELDRLFVPVDEESNALAPFSLNLRVLFETEDPGRRIVSTQTRDESLAVSLLTGESGALRLELSDGAETYTAASDPFLIRPNEPMSISISLFPLSDSAFVMWFRDGLLVGVSELPAWPEVADGVLGSTTIAGESGFVGILDEVGVYFQDEQRQPATYDDAFRHEMARRYGDSLVYAEDFAGIDLPEDIEADGDVQVMTGELLLAPGSRVVFPEFFFAEEDLLFELEGEPSSTGSLSISALFDPGDGERYDEAPAFAIAMDGVVQEPQSIDPVNITSTEGRLRFRLVHEGSSIELVSDVAELAAQLPEAPFKGVVVSVDQANDAAVPLRVHRLLVRRGQEAISRVLSDQLPPE